MKITKNVFLFIIAAAMILSSHELYAAGFARARYDAAIRYIKKNQPDFALMEFRSLLREFPKSSLVERSSFAMAEYYYNSRMYGDAIKSFTGYLKDYPDSKAGIFAKAYLLKIIEEIKDPTWEEKKVFENIRGDLFSSPLFLLFKEYKETSYKSPLRNKFKIRYYIDNIEVYRNGQIFVKITQ